MKVYDVTLFFEVALQNSSDALTSIRHGRKSFVIAVFGADF